MGNLNWKKSFSSKALSEGLELFKNGSVVDYKYDDEEDRLDAYVFDKGKKYTVTVFFCDYDYYFDFFDDDGDNHKSSSENDGLSYYCDCGGSYDDNCRHLTALMYAYDEKIGNISEEKETEGLLEFSMKINEMISEYKIYDNSDDYEPEKLTEILNELIEIINKHLPVYYFVGFYDNVFRLVSIIYEYFPKSLFEEAGVNTWDLFHLCYQNLNKAYDSADIHLREKISAWISQHPEYYSF